MALDLYGNVTSAQINFTTLSHFILVGFVHFRSQYLANLQTFNYYMGKNVMQGNECNNNNNNNDHDDENNDDDEVARDDED